MRVLLLSTYELGHQPLAVAAPAAALRAAGHDVRAVDLSVDRLDRPILDWAERVAFSVPMHTAMRLALRGAELVRRERPGVPVCFYGLYAHVSRTRTRSLVDHAIAGEAEQALVDWVAGAAPDDTVALQRVTARVPARDVLPPLDRYAHLVVGDEHRLVGYVEASHGCAHRCRHCPVPVVYDGRIRIIDPATVIADVAQLVELGAQHITFGDPDFLNGVHHSLRVIRALHERWPDLTFDVTAKIEHILRHDSVWPEMAASGCLFVVSAIECLSDEILTRFDKGHTAADAARAVVLLRAHGIEMRPSFLPFTPWTSHADVVDICRFVVAHDLIPNVDAVQLALRLLIPEGSLLLARPDLAPFLDGYDADLLTWRWHAADPAVDALQARLATIVEDATTRGDDPVDTFALVYEAVMDDRLAIPAGASTHQRPRLTEPWFC
jgi:radical SAM superfamily enzyme YgiQ (UPF0313 family)